MQAQLRYSTRWFPKSQTMVVWEPDTATRLLSSIFAEKASKHLTITRNKYFYTPSDEYKSFMIRFRGVRK
jgi:hypothetical protein